MMQSTYILVGCYILLAFLLLNFLFQNRWPFWLKALLTICVAVFYYLNYQSFQNIQGWPVSQPLPEKTVVLGSYMVEPDQETGTDGYIHVWIDDVSTGKPLGLPRAYTVPYSADLHERFLEARKRSGNGIFQILSTTDETSNDPQSPLSKLFGAKKSQNLNLSNLPDPALPGK
jgi:hypothetical protein